MYKVEKYNNKFIKLHKRIRNPEKDTRTNCDEDFIWVPLCIRKDLVLSFEPGYENKNTHMKTKVPDMRKNPKGGFEPTSTTTYTIKETPEEVLELLN